MSGDEANRSPRALTEDQLRLVAGAGWTGMRHLGAGLSDRQSGLARLCRVRRSTERGRARRPAICTGLILAEHAHERRHPDPRPGRCASALHLRRLRDGFGDRADLADAAPAPERPAAPERLATLAAPATLSDVASIEAT
ncbi:hypothetical protein [Paracoccus mutanolyticus]|uniref:hypothetical protein n=1 Tax=Paracoccus mutanolyticus TaxID=1499308 RepID=UPI001679D7BE|nr:hypothetical protein [Paracoccus mutanolyticus]